MELEKAIEFMKQRHEGQKRLQGTPYYNHPLTVSNILKEKGFNETYQIVGLFHDLLEDTDTTYEEIEKMTNNEIATAVDLLTKKPGYIMKEYIYNIEQNEIAKMVKLADRFHNLTDAQYGTKEFQEKYIKETEEWFLDLAKNSVFENDINNSLNNLKTHFKNT